MGESKVRKVVGELPPLEIGDEVLIGSGIYEFTKIKDINTHAQLIFTLKEVI